MWTTPITWISACSGVLFLRKWQSQRWRAKNCARPCSNGCPGRSSMSRPPRHCIVMFNSHRPVWQVTSRRQLDCPFPWSVGLLQICWKPHPYFVPIAFAPKWTQKPNQWHCDAIKKRTTTLASTFWLMLPASVNQGTVTSALLGAVHGIKTKSNYIQDFFFRHEKLKVLSLFFALEMGFTFNGNSSILC